MLSKRRKLQTGMYVKKMPQLQMPTGYLDYLSNLPKRLARLADFSSNLLTLIGLLLLIR
jgi:hypothetical protein